MSRKMRPALLLLSALAITGCTRLSEIGRAPQFAPVENAPRAVSMPMPTPQPPNAEANSLWRPGSRTFLRDQRAAQVGDIVTVLVAIEDRAQLENSTERSRTNSESMGIPRLLGLDASYARLFPNGFDPSQMVSGQSAGSSQGEGEIRRNETVTLRVAAVVGQVLPNGNLAVSGRQQVRVNHEMRDLTVSGVIRPQDIGSDNTVKHDRLAEARIAYGGRGTLSDVQQPRLGQQLLDIVLPF
jgi:flagellar L-ring protein precursor FlgH